jgi:cation/acetate symporter
MPAAKAATASRDLTAELAFLTRALKAPTLRESVSRLAERARAESWSHEEYLAACLQREVAARDAHGGEGRIKAARFPARKSLEEFDFDHARGLKRDQVAHLGTLDFVATRENVIFLGPPGTGKTHLAIGLGIRACQAGHRVLFATASQWVDRLAEAHHNGRLQTELTRLSRYPLLVIDEVGYIPFEPEAANLFFQLVSSRYERASLIVRSAAATSTIVVSIFYLLAQMVGAGSLVGLLLGVDSPALKNLVIVGVGVLMIIYVTFGGMKGTTWVQIVKAVLLMVGTILITFLVLVQFGFNLSDLLGTAAEKSGKGEAFLQPGLLYGKDLVGKIDFLSLGLALVLGTAGLPHILIRFYTTPTAHAARKSVLWAIGLIGSFYLMTLVLGFGAAALVPTGPGSQIQASAGNLASPLLAQAVGGGEGTLGGSVLLALISAVAFATILAVVAGLTLTSASSVAHDLYASVYKKGQASERSELIVVRIAALAIGAVAILLAIPAQRLNIAFLVALAFAVAASANLPALLYNLFWRRFNTMGAVFSIYGGLIMSVLLVTFSPVVSGTPMSLFPSADFDWFPLRNPGLISIPFGFLCGWVGTLISKETHSAERYDELSVRALTGAGAEKAVVH